MATLAADVKRDYVLNSPEGRTELPMVGTDIIYEGAAVGDNGSGLCRPHQGTDPFLGFAMRRADNSAGAASALNVALRTEGAVSLTVVGAASAADVSSIVYCDDDDTFTLTSGGTIMGKVQRWVSGTTCIVDFSAKYVTHTTIT